MLENVQIKNFRCLRQIDVPVRPLTVLLGPNDSGKSAFLAAIRFLFGDSQAPFDIWRNGPHDKMSVTCSFESRHPRRQGSQGTDWSPGSNPDTPVALYQLPSTGIQMLSGGIRDSGGVPVLGGDGQHVPALLDYLLRKDRQRFFAYVDAVRELVPGFEDVDITTPDPSNRQIDLVIERGFKIPANNTSVGLRLLLFFVALAYHPTPPKIILLEEPENGVHPKRLKDLMKLLREITRGVHAGHKAQVILTTHSPHLLDYVDLDTDQVLVFNRNDDGSRSAEPANAERLKNFLDEFMLGEVWYNEGEAGLVERKP